MFGYKCKITCNGELGYSYPGGNRKRRFLELEFDFAFDFFKTQNKNVFGNYFFKNKIFLVIIFIFLKIKYFSTFLKIKNMKINFFF